MSLSERRKLLHTAKNKSFKRPNSTTTTKQLIRPKTSCQVKPLYLKENIDDEDEARMDLMYLIMQSSQEKYLQEKVNEKYKTLNKFYEEKQKYINGFTKADEQFYRYNILYGSNSHSILRSYSPKMRPKTLNLAYNIGNSSGGEIIEKCFKKDEIISLFHAKCADLSITSKPHLEEKFFAYCDRMCLNRKVDFTECNLGLGTVEVISHILKKNTKIAKLIISRNNIQDVGLSALLDGIRENLTLVHLDISSNDITHKIGNKLFKVLETHSSIISLDVSSKEGINRNRLTQEGIIGLESVLKNNKLLEFLNLSGNSLRNEGFRIILNGMSNNSTLHVLNLSNNEIESTGIKYLNTYINKGLISFTRLYEIDLSENPIENEGIEYISSIINSQVLSCLKKLNFSSCKFNFFGFLQFCSELQFNKRLENLDVSKNNLNNSHVSQLKNYFINMNFIKELIMSKCHLGNAGCRVIAEGFLNNSSLTKLDLSENRISDEGFQYFAELIAKNYTLEEIDVSKNSVGDPSAFKFFKNLTNNPTLRKISFYDNQLKNLTGIQIIETLRTNKNLVKLKLRYNRIQLRIVEEISRLIKLNLDDDKKRIIPNIKKEIRNNFITDDDFIETNAKIEAARSNLTIFKEKTSDDIEHIIKLKIEDEKKAKLLERDAEIYAANVKKISDEIKTLILDKKKIDDNIQKGVDEVNNEINNVTDFIKNLEQTQKDLKSIYDNIRIRYDNELKKIQYDLKITNDKLYLAKMSNNSLKLDIQNKTSILSKLEDHKIEEEKNEAILVRRDTKILARTQSSLNIKNSIKNSTENIKRTSQENSNITKENVEKKQIPTTKAKKTIGKSMSQPKLETIKNKEKVKNVVDSKVKDKLKSKLKNI